MASRLIADSEIRAIIDEELDRSRKITLESYESAILQRAAMRILQKLPGLTTEIVAQKIIIDIIVAQSRVLVFTNHPCDQWVIRDNAAKTIMFAYETMIAAMKFLKNNSNVVLAGDFYTENSPKDIKTICETLGREYTTFGEKLRLNGFFNLDLDQMRTILGKLNHLCRAMLGDEQYRRFATECLQVRRVVKEYAETL